MMSTHASLADAGARYLRGRGYEITHPSDPAEREVVATPGPDADSPFHDRGDADRTVAIVPTTDDDPATLAYRLAAATAADRSCLFVVPAEGPDGTAAASVVTDVFETPACVRAEWADGCREFYLEEDRIRVGDRGLALVRAHDPTFGWHEEPSPGPADEGRTGTDARRLVLTVDDDPVASLSSVDALECPSVEDFPFTYRRDPEEKLFRVADGVGDHVGTVPSVAALRRSGFAPVPSPLVPERLFGVPSLQGRWAVAVVRDGEATSYAP